MINYISKDKINWKDQVVCPKCDEPTKKQYIPNGGSGYWRCKICKTKIDGLSIKEVKKE